MLCKQASGYFKQGKLTESLDLFIRAVGLTREIGGIFFAIGVIFARLGKLEEAVQALGRELQLPLSHPKTRQLMDDINTRLKQSTTTEKGSAGFTIFTVPKAFKGQSAVIQRNALRSWTLLTPRPEIFLLGNEPGIAETALEFGLIHLPNVKINQQGTPVVSSIFKLGQENATNPLVAYINTDIILMDNFSQAVQKLQDGRASHFLAVGRRWDFEIWEEFAFSKGWQDSLSSAIRERGILHYSTGIDYFIFSRGLYQDIPPFAIGRTAWDNWLIWYALSKGAQLIDATHAITAIHQEHTYTHCSGGALKVWRGEEAIMNQAMAVGKICTIADAGFALEETIVPFRPEHRLPEPTPQDYVDFKFRQAEAAAVRGDVEQALDYLAYVELNTRNCRTPSGYHLLKTKLLADSLRSTI